MFRDNIHQFNVSCYDAKPFQKSKLSLINEFKPTPVTIETLIIRIII